MPSLYLHIPFCEHKCLYCDFYSLESLDRRAAFVDALCAEIADFSACYRGEPIETIFFGGGTPSLLTPAELERIMLLLHTRFAVQEDAEITLETNPGTVDEAKLRAFRALGVNRLSLGVQSFHEDDLRFLTRIHSADQARSCVAMAQKIGFPSVNLDLIFALPGQTMERWEENLNEALRLGTDHLSAYSLIVERNTPLARMVDAGEVRTLPNETEAAMYARTMERLASAGFEHYEVSNYAKPGRRSRHNMNYWTHEHYLGFGPSAHSFWDRRRWWNIANLSTYCTALEEGSSPAAGEELLTETELIEETVMLGLRSSGIDLERFRRDFGRDLTIAAKPELEALSSEGLVLLSGTTLRLTDKGFLVCDDIVQRLLRQIP